MGGLKDYSIFQGGKECTSEGTNIVKSSGVVHMVGDTIIVGSSLVIKGGGVIGTWKNRGSEHFIFITKVGLITIMGRKVRMAIRES